MASKGTQPRIADECIDSIAGRDGNTPHAGRGTSLDHDIYLVTRLDGYTWEDIRRLIDRATAPARHGKVVLDMRTATPVGASRPGDGWLREAGERLTRFMREG